MTSNSPPQTPAPPNRRRSSIADIFQPRSSTSSNGATSTSAFPSNISTSQPRQNNNPPRRMSISTALGISGSPTNQSSPFGTFSRRRDSFSSSQDSGSPNNEDALSEDNEGLGLQNTPVSPFARRVSFGAQAFGSVRSGRGSFSNGEGFNWGDNFREKSTRPPPPPAPNAPAPPVATPQRSASIAVMEPPKQMPPPQQPYKPDHLGERMLRGDFMMD